MKVCILGTGTMGSSIAKLLCASGAVDRLVIISRSIENAEKASVLCKKYLEKLQEKELITDKQASALFDKIELSTDLGSVKGCNLIIEAVPENKESKESIYSRLSEHLTPEMIVASNTSSMSITEFAFSLPHPGRVVGLHFFNPATAMKLVEIVVGQVTDSEVTAQMQAFAKDLGKEPVTVREAPGFIVNRMLIPMINEAVSILSENLAEAEDIDKAMMFGAGHPMGPLALADLIGTDVCLSIMDTLFSETGDMKYRANPMLRKMVRANLIGRKTGEGFYKY